MMIENQYPIGKFIPQPFSHAQRDEWLSDLEWLPSQLEFAIQNFDLIDLESPYRPGGWTVQQLVHHLADSHMNAYIRFKLALTEKNPIIKPYAEKEWAKLHDSTLPVNFSTTLLHALHKRWHFLLRSLQDEDFERSLTHPEQNKQMTLWFLLGFYAWHGRHHVAHITNSDVFKKINGN